MRICAVRARDAGLIILRSHIGCANGVTTRMALVVRARFKVVVDRDAVIKDEAFTFPEALFFWHVF